MPVRTWKKRESENYICRREILVRFAFDPSGREEDNLVLRAEGSGRVQAMERAIHEIEGALRILGKDPWAADCKVSDEFLTPLFANYYGKLGLPNSMLKTNFHRIAAVMKPDEIHPEITEILSEILLYSQL